jgi:carbamate kinase
MQLTKVVRQVASPSPCQIIEIETIVGLDINDPTQFLPKA